MPYVKIRNNIEILIENEIPKPVYKGNLDGHPDTWYPEELVNENEIESALGFSRFWLWDEQVLELPKKHRFVEEAIENYMV